MTSQRRVILDVLKSARTHPTAYEVYQMVRRRLPQISLATVYRNLDSLSEEGAVRKMELAGAQMRFDGDVSDHYHVRCLKCGCVGDVVAGTFSALEETLRGGTDYEIVGHRLEFLGYCPACGGNCRCGEKLSSGRGCDCECADGGAATGKGGVQEDEA